MRLTALSPLILTLLAPLHAAAQEGGPRIVFKEPLHDFGRVYQGAEVAHVFEFQNLGDAPLLIRKVEPSCVCTLVRQPEKPIPPGGRDFIKVAFDTGERRGFEEVYVRVTHNDESQLDPYSGAAVTTLRIRGEILNLFQCDPPRFNLGRLTRGATIGRSLQMVIRQVEGKAVELDGLLSCPSFAEVKTAPTSGGVAVTLTIKEELDFGRLEGAIEFKTRDPRQPKLRLPLNARVGTIYEAPPMVFFDPMDTETKVRVAIQRFEGEGLELLGVDYDRGRFRIQARVLQPGKLIELAIDLREGATPGPFASPMTLRFEEPKQPSLTISLVGVIAEPLEVEPRELRVKGRYESGAELGRLTLFGPGLEDEDVVAAFVEGAPAAARFAEGSRRELIIEATEAGEATRFAGARVVILSKARGRYSLEVPLTLQP